MRFTTVDEWLRWQEHLHPAAIELGLERVGMVADALGLRLPAYRVITVAGTNGKGSCVAYLDACLRAAGHRVGRYTSPHLLRYHERIAVDDREIGDAALCAAFAAVDDARGDTPLTYFEFGTLAALHHFGGAGCDAVVLEVGMGGRLDATNIVDADATLLVSVGIDHTEWLGPDRESIGHEKAGIFRQGRPAVCADRDPPQSVIRHADAVGAHWLQAGVHYRFQSTRTSWSFDGLRLSYRDLPLPPLPGPGVQVGNAAAALAVLDALPALFPDSRDAFVTGLGLTRLRGRVERVRQHPAVIVDVTHNADGARCLAATLADDPVVGRTLAVCAMLGDKAVVPTLAALDSVVDGWIVAGLDGPRGRDAAWMADQAAAAGLRGPVNQAADVAAAMQQALAASEPDDRIIVFGSFHTAAAALRYLER